MITELPYTGKGEYLVYTSSGTIYLVELLGEGQGGFITRSPASENPSDSVQIARSLRFDNSRLPLVGVSRCAVGLTGKFLVTGLSNVDGAVYGRDTTKVVRIVNVSD